MNLHKVFDLAIIALDEQRQKFAVDANLFKITGAKHGEKSAKRYDEINEAIRILTELIQQHDANGARRMF